MPGLVALVSLLLLTLSQTSVLASRCITFDVSFNLLAFGFNGKDWNVGTQDVWATATDATDITTTGRPPFDGVNTTCYLAQYFNTIYFLNADAKNPTSVYIYDAGAKSWSTQPTTPGSFDYTSFNVILDHDTNVFYALSHGTMFSLDMGTMKAAKSGSIAWNVVQKPDFPQDYEPVMALAQNHIHFLNVGDNNAGEADIFVIHYSYLQPLAQSYPGDNNETFPTTHGKTTSFFKETGVQEEFAFIPDDFSGTYVINVENNSTQTLAPPPVKDPGSSYVAGITSLLQLDSTGVTSFLPYVNGSTNTTAAWSTVKALAAVAPPQSSSSTSSGPKATGAGPTGNTNTYNSSGGVLSNYAITTGLVGLSVLFATLSVF